MKHKDIDQAKQLMNTELIKVQKWFLANKLVLNVLKTHCMTFGNTLNTSNADLCIDYMNIQQVKIVFMSFYR